MDDFLAFIQKKVLLALMLLCLTTSSALASDFPIKMMGQTTVGFLWSDRPFAKDAVEPGFKATQRSRFWFLVAPSENTSVILMTEIDNIWGKNGPGQRGGQLGTDGVNIHMREAYIDWAVPNTSMRVRMGQQCYILPGLGVAHPLLGTQDSVVTMWARGVGITVSNEFTENLAFTFFWMRPSNDNNISVPKQNSEDTADILGIILPINFDGFEIKPWLMYSRSGKNDNGPLTSFTYRPTLTPAVSLTPFPPGTLNNPSNYAEGFWGGFSANISLFDPLRLGWEVNYANIDSITETLDRGGWYTSALVEYHLDDMVPGIMAWYASGDDANISNGSERMPTILGNWYGTDMGFVGWSDPFLMSSNFVNAEPTGTWGLSLYLRDISLIESIKNTVRLSYYRGTNSNSMAKHVPNGYTSHYGTPLFLYLTKGDSITEINADLSWKLYKNLTWRTSIGYMSLDRGNHWTTLNEKSDALSITSAFRFEF